MPETFWIEEYRKKAALPDAVAQSGRGNTFHAVEFLYVVKQAVELLELQRDHDLLDIGCANGLLDIVLSSCCRSLTAVEPVAELAAKAKENLTGCRNVKVHVGHAADLPLAAGSVDRILMVGVLQFVAPAEVPVIFAELQRVLRPCGRIVLGTIPDKKKQQAFLGPYLDGVRQASHLSQEQKESIIARNERSHWHNDEELSAWWTAQGAAVERIALHAHDPDHAYRYHLRISLAQEAIVTAKAS